MKISLVTPTFNSSRTIRDTLKSIAAQNFFDLEYIIIDGRSTDGTLEIIEEYRDRLAIRLVSEPDSGVYDAMNKGIRLATGEVIGILNSDDYFAGPDILKKIAVYFASENTDAVYGDIIYVQGDDHRPLRYWRAGQYAESKLAAGWTIPHIGFFARRDLYKGNPFRTDLRLAGDYEFFLRILKNKRPALRYLPETIVYARTGGLSGRNLKQRIIGWKELRRAWRLNGWKVPPFFLTRRLLSKIPQYLYR